MINLNLDKVSFTELVNHLREVEKSPLEVSSGTFRKILCFRATEKEVAHISNIETICMWTAANGYSASLTSFADTITVTLTKLY